MAEGRLTDDVKEEEERHNGAQGGVGPGAVGMAGAAPLTQRSTVSPHQHPHCKKGRDEVKDGNIGVWSPVRAGVGQGCRAGRRGHAAEDPGVVMRQRQGRRAVQEGRASRN